LRLIACRHCHTQFDAEQIAAPRFECRCGATVENRPIEPHDAAVVRCGSCGAALDSAGTSCSFCGSAVERRPDPTGPVCPECFARTPAGSRFCTACGVAFRPEPLVAEARELPCPACSVPMSARTVAGEPIDECGTCQGLWVPEGRLERLVAGLRETGRDGARPDAPTPRVRGGNPAVQRVEYRRCPECDAYMQRRNFRRSSGIIVDVCRRHGTWLDADELERIAGFLLTRGADADFVTARSARPAPEPSRSEADAAFARILAEHGALEPRPPDRSLRLLELLFGRIR
jgi:Zn-finger nucleic acid-binding protein